MMLEMMTMAKMQIPPPDIRGDVIFQGAGTKTWVCPDGVRSVCMVLVGPGVNGDYDSTYARGGAGGALRYRNSVSVVPGQTYNIVIGANGGTVSALGTTVGSAKNVSGPWDGGSDGGTPQSYSGQGTSAVAGGQGGSYLTGGAPGSNNGATSHNGPDLYGKDQNGTYGSGGGASTNGGGGGRAFPAMGGAVRLMWGRGRWFPSNAK